MEENKSGNNILDKLRLLIILFVISIIMPFTACIFLPPIYFYVWVAIIIDFISLLVLTCTTIILSIGSKTSRGYYIYSSTAIIAVIIYFASMGFMIDARNYIYITRNETELNFLVLEVKRSGVKSISVIEGDTTQFVEIKKLLRKYSIQDVKVLNDSCLLFMQGGFLSADGIAYSKAPVKPKEYHSQTITAWFHIKDNWYWWGT